MATIKNIIQTVFSSQGAGGTITDLNNLGRAQTRLSQSSASAGRAFSAQASGLGGLVAAYAGAAATTFALQQAYAKLAESARSTQTLQGLNALAANAGANAQSLLNSVREITNSQLTIVEAAQQTNLALSAGFSTKQIEGLSGVAIKASRALGRDLTDAMTRVTRGSAKMETELLDELGIYTKIEPATRAYAAAIGKSVSQLSEYERRQAFVNSVIAEGEKKFKAINTTIPTSAERIEALGVKIVDLGTKFGSIVADVLAPLASFLTNNLVASFSLVGATIALIASKGISVLSAGIQAFTIRMVGVAAASENTARSFLGLKSKVIEANNAIKSLDASILTITAAQREELKTLQQLATQRALSTAEMNKAVAITRLSISSINAEIAAKNNLIATSRAEIATKEAAKASARSLYFANQGNVTLLNQYRAATLALANAQRTLNPIIAQTEARVNALNLALAGQVAVTQKVTQATTGLAAAAGAALASTIRIVSGIGAVISAAALSLLGFATNIFLIITVLGLLTTAITKLFGLEREFESFITKLSSAIVALFNSVEDRAKSKALNEWLTSSLTSIAEADSKLRDLDNFTFTTKFIGIEIELTKTREDLINEVQSAIQGATTVGFSEAMSSTSIAEAFNYNNSLNQQVSSSFGAVLGGAIAGAIAIGLAPLTGGASVAFIAAATAAGGVYGAAAGQAYAKTFLTEAEAIQFKLASIDVGLYQSQYSAELAGLTKDQQDYAIVVLDTLTKSYKGAELFNSEARKALELQVKTAIQAIKIKDNLQLISIASAATGKSLEQISKEFDISYDRAKGIGTVVAELVKTPTITIEIVTSQKTDQIFERLKDLQSTPAVAASSIASKIQTIEEAADASTSGVNVLEARIEAILGGGFFEGWFDSGAKEFDSFKNAVINATGSYSALLGNQSNLTDTQKEALETLRNYGVAFNDVQTFFAASVPANKKFISDIVLINGSLQDSVLQATSNIVNLRERLRAGAISQEEYAQGIAAAEASLDAASLEVNRYTKLQAELGNESAGVQAVVKSLTGQIDANIVSKQANIGLLREEIDLLNKAKQGYADYATKVKFASEFAKKSFNALDFSVAMSNASRGMDSSTSALEILVNQADAAKSYKVELEKLQNELNSFGSAISNNIKQQILSTSTESVSALQEIANKSDELQVQNGKLFIRQGNQWQQLSTLSQDAIDNQELYTKSIEATTAIGFELLINSKKMVFTLGEELKQLNTRIQNQKESLNISKAEIALKLQELQLSKELADIESAISLDTRKIEIATQLLDVQKQISDNAIKQRELDISTIESISELQDAASARAIDRLKTQKDQQQALFDVEQKLYDLRVNTSKLRADTGLADSAVQAGDFTAIPKILEDSYSKQQEIIAAEESLLNRQIQFYAQNLNSELDIIAAESIRQKNKITSELEILEKQKQNILESKAQAERDLDSQLTINSLREKVLNSEKELEDKKLSGDISSIKAQQQLLVDKANLELNQQSQALDLEKEKATRAAKDLVDQYDLLASQGAIFDAFIQNYKNLLEEEARLRNKTPATITITTASQDFTAKKTELQDSVKAIAQAYDSLKVTAVSNSSAQLDVALAALDTELSILERKKQDQNDYYDAKIRLEKLASAQIISNLETEVKAQQVAVDNIVEAITAKQEEFGDAAVQAAKSMQSAFVEASDSITERFAKVMEEGTKLIAGFISESERLKLSTKALENETITIKLKAQFDAQQAASELQQQLAEADIARLQAEIRLTDARADIKEIPAVKAAEKVNELQQKILAKQQEVEGIRFAREEARIVFETTKGIEESARIQAEIEARRDIVISEARSRKEAIQAQAVSTARAIIAQAQIWNSAIDRLREALQTGAASIGRAIATQGKEIGVVTSGAAITPDITGLMTVLKDSDAAFEEFSSSVEKNAAAALEAEQARAQAFAEQKTTELIALGVAHDATMTNLGIQSQAEDALAKKRLQDAKESGSKAAEEAKEASQKIVEAYKDIEDKLREAVRSVTGELIGFVGSIITSIAENKIKQLQLQETQLQDALSFSTEKLNQVRGDLEKSLDEEASQREQLIELTKALTESQESYIESLGAQDKVIAESSDLYIERLLEQKKTIVSLAAATKKSVALAKQEEYFSKSVSGLQQSLESVTEARVNAEERLATTQGILQAVTDAVNSSSQGLAGSLLNLRSAMIAMQQVSGAAAGGGINLGQVQQAAGIQRAFGDLSNSVKSFQEGVQKLAQVNGKFVTESGKAIADVKSFGTGMNTAVAALGGAQTGFGIGSTIAAALGKSGFATQIGGALGGALGSVLSAGLATGTGFLSGVATSIGNTIGAGLAGALFSFALPVIGSLIGALFAKTPKSGAVGEFNEQGEFGIVGAYDQGGASSAGLQDTILGTYKSFFGTLEQLGIELSEGAKDFRFVIQTRKSQINAWYQDLERGIDLITSVSNAQEAAEYFIDSFLKYFERGDLVVNGLLPFADNLQTAIDTFAGKAIGDRTYESFKRAIDFATEFDDSITALQGSAVSASQAFELVEKAAIANSLQSALYYTRFLDQTKEVFGEASAQYELATASVRKNALALIGLAEVTTDGLTSLASISDLQSEINSGALLVADAIISISNASKALSAAGLTDQEVETSISRATELAIDSIVTDINDSLTQGISLLTNPANAAVLAIENLTTNSADRIAGIQGAYDELVRRGASEQQLAVQAENIQLAETLSQLQLKKLLSELSVAELNAVASSDKLSDSIRDLAASQLEATRLFENLQANKILFDTAQQLSSTLSDLTGDFIRLNRAGALASSPGVFEISKALGENLVSDFAVSVSALTDRISVGEDVSKNYAKALAALERRLARGAINSKQYADAVALVSETFSDYTAQVTSLFEEYKSVVAELSKELNTAIETFVSSIVDFGDAISTGVESFADANKQILKIYDDTLSNIASSGNKLFDLQDRARSSYEDAAKAVRDFERENKLTGRTTAQVTQELDTVKQKIQDTLGADTLDFSGFVGLSQLTSQQRALEIELRTLAQTEAEYKKLLKDRDQAQEDLAFVESTILALGDQLIDTRIKESEIIQQTKEATVEFVRSNEELKTITKLLATAQFDLNQRRFDEENAITKTVAALDTYITSLNTLSGEFENILSEDFVKDFVERAVDAAKAAGKPLDGVRANARASARELQKFARAFSDEFIPDTIASREELLRIANKPIDFSDDELPYSAVIRAQLTDRFTQFNDDLVEYLDQKGLKRFYKEGGVFSEFRKSLEANLILDGFDPLIASGGPLESFNGILYLVGQSLGNLTERGATFNTTFEGFNTNLGTFVTAIGETSEGVKTAVASLLLDKDTVLSSGKLIDRLNTSIGTFISTNTVESGQAVVNLIGKRIPDAIKNLVTNVTNLDLKSIPNVGVTIRDAVLDSLEQNIIISSSEVLTEEQLSNIAASFNLVNSTVGKFDPASTVVVGDNAKVQSIRAAFNLVNSTVGKFDPASTVVVGDSAKVQSIKTAFNLVNSTVGKFDPASTVVVGDSAKVQSIKTAFNLVNSVVGELDPAATIVVGDSTKVQSIRTAFNLVNSTVGKFDPAAAIVVGDNAKVQSIRAAFNLVNSTVGKFDPAATNEVGDKKTIISIKDTFNSVNSAVSGLKDITSIDNLDAKSKNLKQAVNISKDLLSSLNISSDIQEFAANIPGIISKVLASITGVDDTKAEAMRKAGNNLSATVEAISDEKTLKAIKDYNTAQDNAITNVARLKSQFDSLNEELSALTGTDGSLKSLNDFFSDFVDTIKDKWDTTVATFSTNVSAAGLSVEATLPSGGALSQVDKDNLATIATNSKKYPKIENVKYTTPGAFASGGYVSGPGTATSDSIPARLSNGEYVLRASTVDKLGKNMLDQLNATGDINSALASAGRYGDTLVAHINQREAEELRRMGGSGTRNPQTGLLEFFNADAGAVGKVFAEQEAEKLYNLYSSELNSLGNIAISNRAGTAAFNEAYGFLSDNTTDGFRKVQVANYALAERGGTPYAGPDVMDQENYNKLAKVIAASMDLAFYTQAARNSTPTAGKRPTEMRNIIGTREPNRIAAYSKDGLFRGRLETEIGSDQKARVGEYLNLLATKSGLYPSASYVNLSEFSRSSMLNYINELNKDRGNFTDFYMLRDTLKAATLDNNIKEYIPPPLVGGEPGQYGSFGTGTSFSGGSTDGYGNDFMATGGLVTRDRVQSLLEPGEFVLRKQAVDKMGLDAAIRLNGNGTVDSDVNVEVNVINNGTAQTPISEPQVRRENGKIVVDIILEDLRNNGPIKQQIRSIR